MKKKKKVKKRSSSERRRMIKKDNPNFISTPIYKVTQPRTVARGGRAADYASENADIRENLDRQNYYAWGRIKRHYRQC